MHYKYQLSSVSFLDILITQYTDNTDNTSLTRIIGVQTIVFRLKKEYRSKGRCRNEQETNNQTNWPFSPVRVFDFWDNGNVSFNDILKPKQEYRHVMIITVGKSGLTDVLDTLHNIWSTVSHFCAMVNSIHKIKLFDRKNFSLKLQANFFLRKYI